jgi:hypothetical protein
MGFSQSDRGSRLATQRLLRRQGNRMPRSMPDAPTLLGAAVKYLEDELLPSLDGYHRFKTRVTVNVLNTVRRELEMRGAQAEAERARLVAILGHDGPVDALSLELSERIRSGAIDLNDPALRAHLRQSVADALAINNPKWIDR